MTQPHVRGRGGCVLQASAPAPFCRNPLSIPTPLTYPADRSYPGYARGSFNGSMPLKDPLDVSRRSLDREVVAVVLQALLQSLLQLLNAATLHEHVPVGTCGLLILGVGGGITVD